ncbi:GNAT family N-acetyltransferase [Gorillibacterium massiliense]|uniref:GNAT family N-acetyltransferase n=1 Tax=Gorillibacterium massiliense TaxID=1280390 RepID=UPI0004AE9B18|nr:GNAT family N-acetyltransferase [Gorillibacterium massiliense]
MLQRFDGDDPVLKSERFLADEVRYNLVHRICESHDAVCLKTPDDSMIYAQSVGRKGWLWIADDLAEDRKDELLSELTGDLQGASVPGISGAPETVERFAQIYTEANRLHWYTQMEMEAYVCADVKKRLPIKGGMLQAADAGHVDTVAGFLAGFSQDRYGMAVDRASQLPVAEDMVGTGGLYLWMVDGIPVSMANIAHRSPRHGRINAVHTPPEFRKKGYASAVVAGLCSRLAVEDLIPMLYADVKNPDANKVYQTIGFMKKGKVVDIAFR